MLKPRRVELKLTPAQAADDQEILQLCAKKLKKNPSKISVVPVRRAVDARRGEPKIVLSLDIWEGPAPAPPSPIMEQAPDKPSGDVVIVGAGPAGYFCALELLLLGKRPIVLERGKDVRERR
ncbi:MAG: FAD-dependent monooxygenase, partial [Candidatus Eremiobacteraeota bacterium]|nr:FAD-dependent monooxygenase [Candidatus Eremiobacteraeota bacterium]